MPVIERQCDQCHATYPAKRATSRFCSAACRAAHRRNPSSVDVVTDEQGKAEPVTPGTVVEQVETALAAVEGRLGDQDAAAVAVLRLLARRMDQFTETLIVDKDTPALFLRYCEALGLTPSSRSKLPESKEPTRGKLASVSNIPRPA
ncbi:terminase small subunit [Terrabacter terrigena]|uniref:Terminase small subunit actinomycetes phage-type domain-containing protein n=1 Tax=Terrabacter terrigena TaxID=574718 RepID=A0ABW3MWW0_9MICO